MDMEQVQQLQQNLIAYLEQVTGETVVITNAKPLAGGASRETWYLEVTIANQPQKLVLRRDMPTQMFEDALTRDQEFRLMRAAYETDVTVAKVLWSCDDPSVLDSDFFIMEYRDGISIGRKVLFVPELENARQKLPDQLAQELARIHTIDVEKHTLDFLLRPTEGRSPTQEVIAQMYSVLDSLEIHNPVWEFALRWADQNQPDCEQMTFVHGDYRIGNLLVNESGLSAVIDWEFGHIGDPLEDIAYPSMRDWRFGKGTLHFAGLCDRETFIQAYEHYRGRSVDRAAVDWWEVIGNIRWGIMCLSQANRHLSGADPSVELASLGRRSAEMQLEALHLIEKIGL
jgi:aminoglycoside phosphotransferase (APT) family kinase protein